MPKKITKAPTPKKKLTKKSRILAQKEVASLKSSTRRPLIAPKTRRVKLPKHASLRPSQHIKHPVRLPNSWQLARKSADVLWQNKKLFIGIALVYGLLNLILVQGLANNTDISSLKSTLDKASSGNIGSVGTSLGVFAILVGSAGNGNSGASDAYQIFLALVSSLAVIWALRQVYTGTKIRIRDTYYRGMYPLVPFILVLLIIGLQLLPLLVGSSIFSLVMTNGIAVHAYEKILWFVFLIAMITASLYMLSSSIFAMYIVTLPDMTPMKAVRSARQLVNIRRLSVLRKVLCLPLLLLVSAAIIMLPIIIWLTALAQWVFFLLAMIALVAAHTYMYTLYRELLNE
jgi:hypothetical protein